MAARAVAAGGEPEARLEDTVVAWVGLVLEPGAQGGADLARALVQFEVSQEMRAVAPNRYLVEWLRRERSRGRRVVFCPTCTSIPASERPPQIRRLRRIVRCRVHFR